MLVPGYETAINISEKGFLLRVSVVNKFISKDYCIVKLNDLKRKYINGNLIKKIEEYFKGKTVLADYGKFDTYKVDRIDFDRSPRNYSFSTVDKDGKIIQITMVDYYKTRYGREIEDLDQPLFVSMLKNKETGEFDKEVFLAPSLMKLAGIDQDTNVELTRELTSSTKLDANSKFIINFR